MKKLQKFFAMLLVFCMAMSLLSVNAFAAEEPSAIQIVEDGGKMYYLANPRDGEVASAENFDVWTSKTIAGTENEDEFKVTLQVGTTMKAIPNDVAVVLVIDTSSSMMADEDGKHWFSGNTVLERPADKTTRIEYAREAALEFSKELVEGSGGAMRMLSVVEFGNNAYTVLPWTDANNNGDLASAVKEAIEDVDVSFKYANKSYWNEDAAVARWGKTDYWDGTEHDAVMKDEFKDEFASYFSDCFASFMSVPEVEMEQEDGSFATVEVSVCTFEGCKNTAADHKHCTVEGCNNDASHGHCQYPACNNAEEHKHCAHAGCEAAEAHKHCAHAGCETAAEHQHCEKCGKTEAHTHIGGCTLTGCKAADVGPHSHACVHGGEGLYPYYNPYTKSYSYRCLDPDPSHTHDVYDGDSYYTLTDHELQKFKTCGTNMEGGLLLARNLLETGTAKGGAIEDIDDIYVILLSDGMPSWHSNENAVDELGFARGEKGGNVYASWSDLQDIICSGEGDDTAIVEDIKDIAKLYAIMYGSSMAQKLGYSGGTKKEDHMLTEVTVTDWFKIKNDPAAGRYNYIGADEVFDTPEANQLNTVFANIKNRIDVLAKAWTVSDELSDDVTFLSFVENGAYAGFTPASGDKNAAVSWSLGNMTPESGDGSVENPYIYTLKYKVKLNSAQDNVKAVSLDHDADSSLEGIWTGTNAKLQYFMIDKKQLDTMTPDQIEAKLRVADFEDVSVKGIYGGLSFIKKHSETGEVMPGVGFTLYDSANKAYGEEVFSDSDGKVFFTNVPRGTYTLKETTVPDGMQQMRDLALVESWGEVKCANGSDVPEEILNYPVGAEIPDDDTSGGNGDSNEGGEGGSTVEPGNPGTPSSPGTPSTPSTPSTPDDTTIEDEDVPMTDLPIEDAEISDEDVPLAVLPEEDVPLALLPATGDASALWMALSALSGAGVFLTRKKRDKE